jgi:hypothetical protein
LAKFHFVALMLDPRPHVRRSASQYITSTENNLSNTPVVRSAVDAFGELAKTYAVPRKMATSALRGKLPRCCVSRCRLG